MTTLYRHRTQLINFPGGPGVSTMYFLDTTTAVASLETFWTALAPFLPGDIDILIEPGGDQISDVNGELTGAWTADPVAEITATGSSTYAAAGGALINWNTATILDGHRVRGRTFVVPICSNLYTDQGQLTTALQSDFQGYANEFVTEQATSFVVWHRPFAGREATTKLKAKAAHDGGHALVTGSSVSTKMAVLRSRRD